MRLAAALCVLLAAPALAQEWSTVEFMARDLKKDDATKAYRGAVAACLAGQGDVEKTAAFFTEAGWTRTDEAEMGTIDYTGPDDSLYVLQAADGSFCAAYSESQGTDAAIANVQIVGGAGGFGFDSAASAMGCIAFRLAPAIAVEITSSGNDPVCSDAATSQVRFTFGAAE
jgi:hypothetical protein